MADFVKDHLIGELKNLPSFKAKDYEAAMKDIYLKIDEILRSPFGKTKLMSYKK